MCSGTQKRPAEHEGRAGIAHSHRLRMGVLRRPLMFWCCRLLERESWRAAACGAELVPSCAPGAQHTSGGPPASDVLAGAKRGVAPLRRGAHSLPCAPRVLVRFSVTFSHPVGGESWLGPASKDRNQRGECRLLPGRCESLCVKKYSHIPITGAAGVQQAHPLCTPSHRSPPRSGRSCSFPSQSSRLPKPVPFACCFGPKLCSSAFLLPSHSWSCKPDARQLLPCPQLGLCWQRWG